MRILVAFLINLLVNFVVGLLVAFSLGPDQFGRFALAMGLGAAVQVLLFDWIRLAAARFYSQQRRIDRPEVRATLDRGFLAVALTLGSLALALSGLGVFGVETALLAPFLLSAALVFAAMNGFFDYQAALLRARFEDGAYVRLVFMKNVLAILLTAGVAYVTGSALATLAGACLGLAGAVTALRRRTRDPKREGLARRGEILRDCLVYGFPLCLSNLLYLLIPLANRAAASELFGYSETGQLALAQDVSLRLVLAIGTALDVLLFQLAVRAEQMHGMERARAQISANFGVIFAVTLPCVAGVWLVLPSFEALIVPADFRGAFAHYFAIMLPGLFCFGLTSFALAPAFQMARRTWPVSVAAGCAVLADIALAALLPRGADATFLAVAQTGALCIGLLVLLVLSPLARPQWPRVRDIAMAAVGTAAMVAATLPLRALAPGVTTLLMQALCGAVVYGIFVLALDVAGLRGVCLQAVSAMRQRRKTPARQG